MMPFDRMLAAQNETNPTPKSMFGVWGANHNFFNTEWQQSDSQGCRGINHQPLWQPGIVGSEKERTAGLFGLMGFFRAHVGKAPVSALNNAYDPLFGTPDSLDLVTHVERAYSDSSSAANNIVLEDFSK